MLATDEDALICDFAETYHVLDIGALDLRLAATLAAGLAPDSRIMRKMSGAPLPVITLLQASCADSLAFLAWANSQDGAEGKNRPQSLLAALTGQKQKSSGGNLMTFASGVEFETFRAGLQQKESKQNGP